MSYSRNFIYDYPPSSPLFAYATQDCKQNFFYMQEVYVIIIATSANFPKTHILAESQ
jgi:hypothetical protein